MVLMNNKRKNSIGFSLVVLMLFSLSGVSLHKMTCSMSGNSFVYVGDMDELCCDEQPLNSISKKCCDISVAAVQITEFETSQKTSIQLEPVVIRSFEIRKVSPLNYPHSIVQLANAPPPRTHNIQAILEVYKI